MPRKPTTKPDDTAPILALSHSQLETWEQCAYRWYLTKIVNVQQAPSEAFILGNAFHATLEDDGNRKIATLGAEEFEEESSVDALYPLSCQHLKDELAKADPTGLVPADRIDLMRRKLKAMITAYVEHIAPRYTPLTTEESFEFMIDGTIKFAGRIDAITPRAIVDWKTASKLWPPEDVLTKDQATAYLIAMPEEKQVTFIVFSCSDMYPDACIVQSHIATRTDAQKAAYQAKVRVIAGQIRQAKQSNKYPVKTGPLCGSCNVLGSCGAGQSWMESKGRTAAVPMVGEVLPPSAPNAAPEQYCPKCNTLAKITSSMFLCARPISKSSRLHYLQCQTCQATWTVSDGAGGRSMSEVEYPAIEKQSEDAS